jgi:energy-coupling factor transport system permease protein
MECRLYHGGDGRTRMTQLRYKGRDYASLCAMLLFCAACVICNYLGIGYSM